jgi:hypothetical protein
VSEEALTKSVSRATRAQKLVDDELLVEAFTTLEEAYIAAWRATTIEDVSGREKLFLAINIVGKVRSHLNTVVTDGKLAAAELKQLAETAERKKRFGIL